MNRKQTEKTVNALIERGLLYMNDDRVELTDEGRKRLSDSVTHCVKMIGIDADTFKKSIIIETILSKGRAEINFLGKMTEIFEIVAAHEFPKLNDAINDCFKDDLNALR